MLHEELRYRKADGSVCDFSLFLLPFVVLGLDLS